MPTIKTELVINASKEVVFDLARSIELHIESTKQTGEKAIDGKTSGLLELHETVTWQATHFGIKQKLTSKMVELDYPNYFVDEMVTGAFKSFKHKHIFTTIENNKTLMVDVFDYQSPLGLIGKLADQFFLKKYMTSLLVERNKVIKSVAEKMLRTHFYNKFY